MWLIYNSVKKFFLLTILTFSVLFLLSYSWSILRRCHTFKKFILISIDRLNKWFLTLNNIKLWFKIFKNISASFSGSLWSFIGKIYFSFHFTVREEESYDTHFTRAPERWIWAKKKNGIKRKTFWILIQIGFILLCCMCSEPRPVIWNIFNFDSRLSYCSVNVTRKVSWAEMLI